MADDTGNDGDELELQGDAVREGERWVRGSDGALVPEVLPAKPVAGHDLAPKPQGQSDSFPSRADSAESVEVALVDAGYQGGLPELVLQGGAQGVYADFFIGEYDNAHTRRAYKRHVDRFLAWCDSRELRLQDLRAHHVGAYRDGLRVGPASKRQVLAALRKFFDPLVERHFCLLNPARAAANPRTDEVEGQTPEIPFEVIEATIKSIDTGTVVGLRDRAVLAMLASTGCRVGALATFDLSRYYFNDGQWFVKLHEKNSKVRDVPVRHDLQRIIHSYLEEAGLTAGHGKEPLFRTAIGKTGRLREYSAEVLGDGGLVVSGEIGRMSQDDLRGMLKRRLVCAGYGTRETMVTAAGHKYTVYRSLYSPHSFRVTVLTDLISQGEDIQDVAYLAGHSSTRTTQGYDRTKRAVKRNLVERIRVELD